MSRQQIFHQFPVDVLESESSYMINGELPGVSPSDFDIKCTPRKIYIKCFRKRKQHDVHEEYYAQERKFGHFFREIPFEDEIDMNKIKTKYENGIIHITIPKLKPMKKESISIPITHVEQKMESFTIDQYKSYFPNLEFNEKAKTIYDEYTSFFNDFRIKNGLRKVPFTLDDVKELFKIAAIIVQSIRSFLDSQKKEFTLRMIGGQFKEFLWSVDKNPNPFKGNTKEDAKNFVRGMVHHTLQDGKGYVENLTESFIEQVLETHFDHLYERYILAANSLE